MATVCAACLKRGKTWEGGDPLCAFRNGQPFQDNWNCATVNEVRDICGSWGDPESSRVDRRFGDDQSWASINIGDIDLPYGGARTLWLSWYKRRGRTEAMWLLDEYEPPRLPTEDDLVAIVAAINNEISAAA